MNAENPADVIEAALLRMWDDGNATGLDGWVGPDRGSEPDDYAIEVRRKRVDRELEKLAHLLADPADRDEVTFISEEARMRASELDPQAIIRNLIQDKQTIAELVTKNRERAERAEAEVAELRATVDRVAMLRDRWARMAGEAMDADTRKWLDAASKSLRAALDGGEQRW